MGDSLEQTALGSIAALTGEAFAKAVTTLARGERLLPFGLKRSGNGGEELRELAVGKNGDADLVASAQAAFNWLEEEASRADVCMIVLDGSIGEDDEPMDAIIGRVVSLPHRLMVEIALPYEPNDGEEGHSFSEPMYRFSDIVEEDEKGGRQVDPDAFDSAFRDAFMTHAPTA